MKRIEKYLPCIVVAISGIYYYILSSKIFTWIYTSGDAGDWLALDNWWYVPHQWGKPLIVVYIRFLSLFPVNDVAKLTIALAVIPASITVMLTYIITKKLTGKVWLSLIAPVVLLSAVIFTTQATVLEQYTFTAMFLTAAFYFQITEHRKLTMLFLGLTTATHIVGLPITFLWIVCTLKEWREWLKVSPIYIISGLLPYTLILGLMANPDTPKLVSGGLSWESINSYLGNTTTGVNLALVETPHRLSQFIPIFLITLGVSIVPLIIGLKDTSKKYIKIAIAIIVFVTWFYFTNLFPSVWKWSTLWLPIASVFVVIGLTRLPKWHINMVVAVSVVMILVNGICMNSNTLAHESPQATEYLQSLKELPAKSCVLAPRGGQYGFTLFYALSEGYDLIPLMQGNPLNGMGRATFHLASSNKEFDQSYADYLDWLHRKYPIQGDNMYEIIQYALDNGYEVYYGQTLSKLWSEVFIFDDINKLYLQKILAINPDFDTEKWLGELPDDNN